MNTLMYALILILLIFVLLFIRRVLKIQKEKAKKERELKAEEEEERELKAAGIKKNYIPIIVAIISFVIIILVYAQIISYLQIEVVEYGFWDYLIIIGIPSGIYGLLNKKLNSNLLDFKLKKEDEKAKKEAKERDTELQNIREGFKKSPKKKSNKAWVIALVIFIFWCLYAMY